MLDPVLYSAIGGVVLAVMQAVFKFAQNRWRQDAGNRRDDDKWTSAQLKRLDERIEQLEADNQDCIQQRFADHAKFDVEISRLLERCNTLTEEVFKLRAHVGFLERKAQG